MIHLCGKILSCSFHAKIQQAKLKIVVPQIKKTLLKKSISIAMNMLPKNIFENFFNTTGLYNLNFKL
jgi:hypothetical protein